MTISYLEIFCISMGTQNPVSCILGEHHTTRPSRLPITVTFTPFQGESMSLCIPSSEITLATKLNSGLNLWQKGPVYTYCHRQSLTLCQSKRTVWWTKWVRNPIYPSNSPSLFTQCKFDGDCDGHGDGDGDCTCKQAFSDFKKSLCFNRESNRGLSHLGRSSYR